MFHPAPFLESPVLPERRRTPRFSLMSLALVLGEAGQSGHCTVENLSSGGALLTGSIALVVGEAIRVVHPLRDQGSVSMVGRVVRRRPLASAGPQTNAGQFAYGVMFVGASLQAAEAALRHAQLPHDLESLRPQRAPVLVLDATAQACAPTVQVLARAGVPAVGLTNAFDALGWLLSEHRFAAAVVNPQPRQAEGSELLRYLADEHPEVQRIAIHAVQPNAAALAANVHLHGALSEQDAVRLAASH